MPGEAVEGGAKGCRAKDERAAVVEQRRKIDEDEHGGGGRQEPGREGRGMAGIPPHAEESAENQQLRDGNEGEAQVGGDGEAGAEAGQQHGAARGRIVPFPQQTERAVNAGHPKRRGEAVAAGGG